MPRKILTNIILLTIMVFSTIALIGFIIWNQPHRNVKNATAVKITAVELYHALSHDSTKTKSFLINKVIAVTGEVKQIIKNREGAPVILLKTSVPDASVNCTMEGNVPGIKAGDRIEIKGICVGYINGDEDLGLPGDVFLTRGYTTL